MKMALSFPEFIEVALAEFEIAISQYKEPNHYELYTLLRKTATKFASLDSFYIGLYCEENMMVFPYSYDGNEYHDPNKFAYKPNGLAAWILRHKKSYCFEQDNGKLLSYGKSYGQLDKRSCDAIVVPLIKKLGRTQKIIGVMSMQTYTAHSYKQETIDAFSALAKLLMAVFEKEEVVKARAELALQKDKIAEPMLNPSHVVNQMLEKMQSIKRKGTAIKTILNSDAPELVAAVEDLLEECYRRQTETIEIFLPLGLTKGTPLEKLTARELKVVLLLAEGKEKSEKEKNGNGYTTRDLAAKTGLSDETIHTRLGVIYKKLGVSNRHEVVEMTMKYIKPFS